MNVVLGRIGSRLAVKASPPTGKWYHLTGHEAGLDCDFAATCSLDNGTLAYIGMSYADSTLEFGVNDSNENSDSVNIRFKLNSRELTSKVAAAKRMFQSADIPLPTKADVLRVVLGPAAILFK